MKATETIKGRISGRFNGLGTVTPEMVEQRAREIALINGRAAEEFNEADLEEARVELTGEAATEEQIQAFCRERIAHYKVPRYVRVVDEFPMTITGKAQKYLMRRAMAQELGLFAEKTA